MTTQVASTRRKRPRLALLGVAIVAVLVGGGALAYLLGGYIADSGKPVQPITINGSVTLGYGAYEAEDRFGAPCQGDGGYSDIRAGAQVAVRDASGKVVAVGRLEQGYSSFNSCTANFTLKDVPGGEEFYGVTIADRNELQYTKAQLAQRIELSLG